MSVFCAIVWQWSSVTLRPGNDDRNDWRQGGRIPRRCGRAGEVKICLNHWMYIYICMQYINPVGAYTFVFARSVMVTCFPSIGSRVDRHQYPQSMVFAPRHRALAVQLPASRTYMQTTLLRPPPATDSWRRRESFL